MGRRECRGVRGQGRQRILLVVCVGVWGNGGASEGLSTPLTSISHPYLTSAVLNISVTPSSPPPPHLGGLEHLCNSRIGLDQSLVPDQLFTLHNLHQLGAGQARDLVVGTQLLLLV